MSDLNNNNNNNNNNNRNNNHNKNWSKKCEDALNLQIYTEYWASLQYHIIFAYFDRHSVGLRNVAEYFNKSSLEEREHAHKFMHYQNQRGGKVCFDTTYDINFDLNMEHIEHTESKSDVLCAFEKALEMEQLVYEKLLELHKVADENTDPQFSDYIEGEFLEEQITAIDELNVIISKLKLIGNDGHGLWNFDANLLKN